MKYISVIFVLFLIAPAIAQTNTEVFLFDLDKKHEIIISTQTNISNNTGYNNQPSFFNDNTLIFSSTRNDQTDIAVYNIANATIDWLTNTIKGSEYSPTPMLDEMAISSIRLDKDGTQLLYRYDYKTGKSKVLIEDLKVGYHCWYNKDIIVASVVEEDGLNLVVSNLKNDKNHEVQKKVGRSLHKIPNSKLISFISKGQKIWEIKSLDPKSGTTAKIGTTLFESEDMCWLPDGTILMGKENKIYKFNPNTDVKWGILCTFNSKEIKNITRLATNSLGTKIAIVADSNL